MDFHAHAIGEIAGRVLGGALIGCNAVVLAISFAAIIFTGPLGLFLSKGIALSLTGAVILSAVGALFVSYRGTICLPQDTTAVVLGLAAASIAASGIDWEPESLYATVALLISVTTLVTGVTFLALGYWRLGDLARYIPYPVLGGFMTATGWLLVLGAIKFMTGGQLSIWEIGELFRTGMLATWLPGTVLGVLLLVLARCSSHWSVIPLSLVVATVLFYSVCRLLGLPMEEASNSGLLLGPFEAGGFDLEPSYLIALQADFGAIFDQVLSIFTATALAVFGLMLNAAGIEAGTGRDVDVNRDLSAVGAANLVGSAFGGLVGYHSLGQTSLAHRVRAAGRMVPLMSASICAIALLFGAEILSYLPKAVFGGVVAYLGFDFLYRWLHVERRRLPVYDFAVVLLILSVAATVGFLSGIATGILAGAAVFIIRYSRAEVVHRRLDCRYFRSTVHRSEAERDALARLGSRMLTLELQGFIFFGTANSVLNVVRREVEAPGSELEFVLLDFLRVQGFDSSTVFSFSKLQAICAHRNVNVVLSNLSQRQLLQFGRGGIDVNGERLKIVPSLDAGLEWIENELLREIGQSEIGKQASLEGMLVGVLHNPTQVSDISSYFETETVERGHHLIRQGEAAESLLFVESGSATIQLEDGYERPFRLGTIESGVFVGEVGLYTGVKRTASVVANERCVVRRLGHAALVKMEAEDKALAAALHRFAAVCIARRLSENTRLLESMTQDTRNLLKKSRTSARQGENGRASPDYME